MEQVDQKKSLSQQLHDKASKISIGTISKHMTSIMRCFFLDLRF